MKKTSFTITANDLKGLKDVLLNKDEYNLQSITYLGNDIYDAEHNIYLVHIGYDENKETDLFYLGQFMVYKVFEKCLDKK